MDSFRSIRIAIIAAPIIRNGQRVARRIIMFRPLCTVLESLVIRVISEAVPIRSTALCERVFTWRYSARRSAVPKP